MSSTVTKKRIRANEQIRVPQVRLIGEDGSQLGIVNTKDALQRAQEVSLDLVEVAPEAKPPVCRLMDLGKYIYSLDKKEKESRKKQKVVSVKEVKVTSKIEQHDYETKLRNARRFIERGDKVKLTLVFRGREVAHKELGDRVILRFIQDMSDMAEVERQTGLEGKMMQVYFTQLVSSKKPASEDPKVGESKEGSGSQDAEIKNKEVDKKEI